MTEVASAAASTCKRIGRNTSASHGYGGDDDSDSVQPRFRHDSFLPVYATFVDHSPRFGAIDR
jgi:hypothetical protein